MSAEKDDSVIVIRFSPFGADRLRENAEDTFADDLERHHIPARFGVSVLAVPLSEDESVAEAVERVCGSTHLGGKKIAVVTGRLLREAGFDLVHDPTQMEPLHHLVGARNFEAVPNVEALASLFVERRMNNPIWTRRLS